MESRNREGKGGAEWRIEGGREGEGLPVALRLPLPLLYYTMRHRRIKYTEKEKNR